MPRIKKLSVPYFTTIQKAFTRPATAIWRVLLRLSASFFPRGKLSGIDASGYERNYASHYYTMRAQLKLSSIKITLLMIEPPTPGWIRSSTVEEGIL